MGSSSSIQDEIIKLPITQNVKPDWEYMENFMAALLSNEAYKLNQLLKL